MNGIPPCGARAKPQWKMVPLGSLLVHKCQSAPQMIDSVTCVIVEADHHGSYAVETAENACHKLDSGSRQRGIPTVE